MSGFVGMLNLDGAPVDRALLERLTQSLAFRGPDGLNTWAEGPVGFGHTLFRTTWESARESQPLGIDAVWIVADARVDGREELARKLGLGRPAGQSLGTSNIEHRTSNVEPTGNAQHSTLNAQRSTLNAQRSTKIPDAEFILRAYLKWGEDCLDHLIGDFAFAIWDARRRKLFCARDHFGVKMFYYAQTGAGLIFSNTLNTIRLHPGVSNRLNEMALGQFLIFNCNWTLDTTFFSDIQKLPGAHVLTVSNGHLVRRKYWQLMEPPTLRLKRDEEYLEGFQARFDQAVADRLRTNQAAISFSGGLDSTNMAATANRIREQSGHNFDLRAFTVVYDHLIPDSERHYAGVAAQALALPMVFLPGDDHPPYAHWDDPNLMTPEPQHNPILMLTRDFNRACAAHSPVMLYGEGGDEILKTLNLKTLWPHHPAAELMRDFLWSLARYHFVPPMGTGILAALRKFRGCPPETAPSLPTWLNPEALRRLALAEQWHPSQQWKADPLDALATPKRRFLTPIWQELLSQSDIGTSQVLSEVRLPFLDLRLVNFALSLPPLPWTANKFILRRLGEKALPAEITRRPKTGLAGDPVARGLARQPNRLTELAEQPWSHILDGLVSRPDWRQALLATNCETHSLWAGLRVVSLNYWLQHGDVTL